MTFAPDELEALRTLSLCAMYESTVPARLLKLGFATRAKCTRYGKIVTITEKGRDYTLSLKNTGKTPVSGLPGLAANRVPRRGSNKVRGVPSMQPPAGKRRSESASPPTSPLRAAAPSSRRKS